MLQKGNFPPTGRPSTFLYAPSKWRTSMGMLVLQEPITLRGQTTAKVEACGLSISSSPCQTCPQSCSKTCRKPVGLLRRSESKIRFKVLSGMVCPLVRACLRSDCRYDEELHYLRSPEWTATTFNRNPDRVCDHFKPCTARVCQGTVFAVAKPI